MPYCTNCGTYVLDADRFCPRCGLSQQPGATPTAGPPPRPAAPVSSRPPQEARPPVTPPVTPPPPPPPPRSPGAGGSAGGYQPSAAAGISTNTAAALCYIPFVGWIAAIIFLTLDPYRTNRYVRFHAFQGLYLAVLWFVAEIVFFPLDLHPHRVPWGDHSFVFFPFFPFWGLRQILKVLVLVAQIVGIVKVRQNRDYRLPVLGELAEKSMV